jgi:hypothetical protein
MEKTKESPGAGSGVQKYTGGCHCGAVRFEADLDLAAGASRCNCSICTKVAQTSHAVKPAAFRLLTDPSRLSMYEWGGKTGQRYFCQTCGIHCFLRGHLEQLGGDYVSINFNCLDDVDPSQLKIGYWDGRHNNWQSGMRDAPWPIFT